MKLLWLNRVTWVSIGLGLQTAQVRKSVFVPVGSAGVAGYHPNTHPHSTIHAGTVIQQVHYLLVLASVDHLVHELHDLLTRQPCCNPGDLIVAVSGRLACTGYVTSACCLPYKAH